MNLDWSFKKIILIICLKNIFLIKKGVLFNFIIVSQATSQLNIFVCTIDDLYIKREYYS